MIQDLFDFLRSKSFRNNLIVALVLLLVLFFVLQGWLSSFTNHGESIAVPDLRGMKKEKMEQVVHETGLAFEIVDSLFELGKSPGTVIDQDPAPKSNVKKGRTIYLTVNASKPPKVKVPNLLDVSYRQAEAILESFGLKVGHLSYKPDLAKNAVLEQTYHGSPIAPGKEVYKGSAIDLTLGDGMGSTEVPVPDLTGMTRAEAIEALRGVSLNEGRIVFDPGVKDTLNAKVYLQTPESGENAVLNQGAVVDIYLH